MLRNIIIQLNFEYRKPQDGYVHLKSKKRYKLPQTNLHFIVHTSAVENTSQVTKQVYLKVMEKSNMIFIYHCICLLMQCIKNILLIIINNRNINV